MREYRKLKRLGKAGAPSVIAVRTFRGACTRAPARFPENN
jgi:hypothetical protein